MSPVTVLPPYKLAHVVLHTANFVPMVNFYKTFLGAHASYETDQMSFLTYDEEHHRIAIVAVPGTTPRNPTASGMDHIAFTYSTLHDLLTSWRQRRDAGVDLDGNRIETQIDTFKTMEEATEFMKTSEFAKNPLGSEFDPAEMLAKLERGESEEVLIQRPVLEEVSFKDMAEKYLK
ncbi:Glyoxalase/Bleomycin resistance protein/Dihydroxybiphenyl dioxygenase [Diaporthe sp. PMI_573]|nr:Glyoxalase/Bleomycin resistance protein/Dihydroxybiphenyl dioxygenase [Diaporthaceae sp. PMI_573]